MKHVAVLLIGNIIMDGRVQKEIRSLRGAGHRVTLIEWPYHGPRNQPFSGADMIRYPPPLSRSAAVNFLRQLLFNLFAFRRLRKLRPDVVQCCDLNTLLAGVLYRKKAPVIFDAHELFPESQSGIRKQVWEWLERRWVPACRAYIQPEKNRRAYFAEKHSIPADRIALVENFPSGEYSFSGRDRLRENLPIPKDSVILLYTGMIGEDRGIETYLEALRHLPPHFILVTLGTTFKGYTEKTKERAKRLGVSERFFLHPPVPNQDMLDFIRCGDISLVFYRNSNLNNYYCASNKLYEAILCGKPVITNDYPGLLEVVEGRGLGVCLRHVDPETLARAAQDLFSRAPSARRPAEFTWEKQEPEYLRLFA